MRFHTSIPTTLKPYFNYELNQYQHQMKVGNLADAWIHLERAHIIGQKYPLPHTFVHWKMLQFGFKIKSRKEILGQIPRLVFGGVKSFVGTIPVGNPGGANVPPLKPFPIDEDLQEIFRMANVCN